MTLLVVNPMQLYIILYASLIIIIYTCTCQMLESSCNCYYIMLLTILISSALSKMFNHFIPMYIMHFTLYHAQVDSSWAAGNYEDARSKSNMAKILNIIGFIVGSVSWVIALIIIIASAVTTAARVAAVQSSYSS